MYLFISRGVAADDENSQQKQQQKQQQQKRQQDYQPYNQPPPVKQHYYQQPQGQYNTNTYQCYPQSNNNSHETPNNYDQFGFQTLPPTYQHTNNAGAHMSRGKPLKANDNHLLSFTPEAVVKEPPKPVRPPTPPKIGWSCPSCTVINDPYRPGCEVCGAARPDDYKPPADYKPTKEEEDKFLKEDKSFEEVCKCTIV